MSNLSMTDVKNATKPLLTLISYVLINIIVLKLLFGFVNWYPGDFFLENDFDIVETIWDSIRSFAVFTAYGLSVLFTGYIGFSAQPYMYQLALVIAKKGSEKV